MLAEGRRVTVEWKDMQWTHRRGAADVARIGDVIRVQEIEPNRWRLAQIPVAESAMVSMDPNTGAIKSLVGGFSYQKSKFNRATQALRQPGSSFKPFIYSAALAKGFTLATVINDAPLVIKNTYDGSYWRPQNYNHQFSGPMRLREALVRSKNLVSIRLLDAIGIPYALSYLKNYGFDVSRMPDTLSLALGTGGVTVLEMAAGYSVLANGGFQVSPYVIDHITDYKGEILYQAQPQIACSSCLDGDANPAESTESSYARHTVDHDVAYLMTSVLQDVIRFGTGRAALVLKRDDIAGKTGTTNDQNDAWFAGFNSDVVTVVWVGFDKPRSLKEYGGQTALPIWIDYMRVALKDRPEHTLPRPTNIVTMRIDPYSGMLAGPSQSQAILEDFSEQFLPKNAFVDQDLYFDNNAEDEPLY